MKVASIEILAIQETEPPQYRCLITLKDGRQREVTLLSEAYKLMDAHVKTADKVSALLERDFASYQLTPSSIKTTVVHKNEQSQYECQITLNDGSQREVTLSNEAYKLIGENVNTADEVHSLLERIFASHQ